jgi:antitoxin component YwqK of YwqJK toxin-antitoxin module
MLPIVLLFASIAVFDEPTPGPAASDLKEVQIPADAVERPAKSFRRAGKVASHLLYLVGDQIVAERFFYENGKLAEEKLYGNYLEHKLHGIWRQYHLNGKLAAERPYRDGVMDGTFRFFDEDGELVGESVIKMETGVLREFRNEGLAVSDKETPFVSGKKHGTATHWARFAGWEEKGVQTSHYAKDKLEGWCVLRDEDGIILSWCFFRDGKLHGVVRDYDRNGQALDGYPKYYINGNEVNEFECRDTAQKDKLLKEILDHQPPKYAKVPEAPSKVAAKEKAAEKARSATKEK